MIINFKHQSEFKLLLFGHVFGNVRINAVRFPIIKAGS